MNDNDQIIEIPPNRKLACFIMGVAFALPLVARHYRFFGLGAKASSYLVFGSSVWFLLTALRVLTTRKRIVLDVNALTLRGGLRIPWRDIARFRLQRINWIPELSIYLFNGRKLVVHGIWLGANWRAILHQASGRFYCLKCGYNLRGNVSGVCPECGTPSHELKHAESKL